MNAFVAHIGLEPMIWGVVIIAGLVLILIKALIGAWTSVMIDITIFCLVFWMHGGTMKGGMAAAVAALIGGIVVPPIIRLSRLFRG